MRKFIGLLKKEIRELLTLQMLIPILIGVVFFVFIGNVVGSESKKANALQTISVLDLDQSPASGDLIKKLSANSFKIDLYTNMTIDQVLSETEKKKITTVITIPLGYEKAMNEFKPQQIDTYSLVRNFSVTGSVSTRLVKTALEAINNHTSNQLILKNVPDANPEELKNPIQARDYVIIGDQKANISADQITGFILSQTTFIPIIMFLVILFSAQMIAVSIASEKENKTLETLLSTPVSRISLVSAKMIAAGVVSLIMAVIYMIGFRYYMNGFMGDAANEAANPQMAEAVKQLGLTLDTLGFVLLGLSLFMSILIALAISIILGAFAEDVKKVQGLLAPITFLIMIPYMLAMFMDVNNTSPLIKLLVYAIPFSHPFLASPNLFLHQYAAVVYGILYQAVVFLVFVMIAVRIFTTDRILTMKLNFGSKRKNRVTI
jgi:ABC-2 type transport system permease protein